VLRGGGEIRPIVGVKIALLAIVVAGILACSGQATPEPQTPTPEVPPSEWVKLDSWDRVGDEDTPNFHIDSVLWRVVWKAETSSVGRGEFIVHVYNVDGTFYKFLWDSTLYDDSTLAGPLRGTLGIKGAGDYFLRVSTTRKYTIGVEEAIW
jgi:hypothetical protein